MKRLVRLVAFAAGIATILAVAKARRRTDDGLPAPATTPTEPWPALRPEDATTASDATPDPVPTPDASPAPNPPKPAAPWTEPTDDGRCPDGYPIKAKMSSKIFHAPGQLNYDRTTPDRCYLDAAAAVADGLRAAKR